MSPGDNGNDDTREDKKPRQNQEESKFDSVPALDARARGDISLLSKTTTRVIDGTPHICLPLGVFRWIICIPPAMRGKMKMGRDNMPAPQKWWRGVRVFVNDNPMGDIYKLKVILDPDSEEYKVPHVEVDS